MKYLCRENSLVVVVVGPCAGCVEFLGIAARTKAESPSRRDGFAGS